MSVSTSPSPPASFSPVTQVLDPNQPQPVEERVSEEQFNSLHASSVTYRDLLIFEERLKLNLIRLKKSQQKYEAFLGVLVLVIAYCTFATFYRQSPNYYIHMLHKFFLLLSCTTLFLFVATGIYSQKLGYSSKFVPQCNRVLRIFNMHFNRDNQPELSFFRKVPRRFQEGFTAYKASYFRRRSEKRAAAAAAAAAASSSTSFARRAFGRKSTASAAPAAAGAAGMNRSGSGGQGGRLQPGRRRVAGSGSASGSDTGGRPISSSSSLGVNFVARGEGRPLMRPGGSMTQASSMGSRNSSSGSNNSRPNSMSSAPITHS
ncbi:hypothetical protein EMPS_07703 [Entomortierella parvispora]|uniref:Transmembrane protein 188 n=1 Tax=Entomortierella parvispora TaxID=205924 RepID=A0A9P3HEN0_9FUNG|nr:hypothetical protein EMPS_07703 [Entomortierella parvispora]